jgi:hypothetical protein
MKKPEFYWNEEERVAKCWLTDGTNKFLGIAACHPNDIDMMSEKVGCELAYHRAIIEALKHERDNMIKPSLKALKQVFYSINRSKKFNKKSYEAKMLWRQIQNWQTDLDTINYMIDTEKALIRDYIQKKEEFYQLLRTKRTGQN